VAESKPAESKDNYKLFNFKVFNKTEKNNNGKEEGKHVGKEKGCTEPLYGTNSKCIIKIVPQDEKQPTFTMDEKCVKKR
jgi:hypothetical protein